MYGRLKQFVIHSDSENDENTINNNNINNVQEKKLQKELLKDNDEEYDYDTDIFKKLKSNKVQTSLTEKSSVVSSNKLKELKFSHQDYSKFIEIKYCDICNKRVNYDYEYNNHITSKKHLKKLKSYTKKELKNSRNLKSFLLKKGLITKQNTTVNKLRKLLYFISLKNYLNN